jgi:hypothetical protein
VKPFTAVVVVILGLVALLQFIRFILGWEITVNGLIIPTWASAIACAVAAALAVLLWREARTSPPR